MTIVLDTNVLVSGLMSATGTPGRIVDLLRAGVLHLAVDDRILAEYRDVLGRPELRPWFRAGAPELILGFIAHDNQQVHSSVVIRSLPDPDDVAFLEVALTAAVPLVTGNARHFPPRLRAGAEVLSPRQFLDRVAL